MIKVPGNFKFEMCGIFCYLFKNDVAPNLDEIIRELENELQSRGPDCVFKVNKSLNNNFSTTILGSTLHLRGLQPVQQPLFNDDDSFLLWNGEIFDGIQIAEEENDGIVLLKLLCNCEDDSNLLAIVSRICGPWAFIFWQKSKQRLWFGRDVLGRRSLLWKFDKNSSNPWHTFTLSSVATRPDNGHHHSWTEVPYSGIFCLDLTTSDTKDPLTLFRWSHLANDVSSDTVGYVINSAFVKTPVHSILNSSLPTENDVKSLYHKITEGIQLRTINTSSDFSDVLTQSNSSQFDTVATNLEEFLLNAVKRRTANKPQLCQQCAATYDAQDSLTINTKKICLHSKVAILFSGGLDSCVLAVLAHRSLPIDESIDLLNVAFWKNKECEAEEAPDRVSACVAMKELMKLAPERKWNFIKIDIPKTEMEIECNNRIADLIYPLYTVLDKDIGCALWFAARGKGKVNSEDYTTYAKVILTGMGADEQFAGYSRHRICFKKKSWEGLLQELSMEMGRIAKRNMGRDDRIISSHGREARFPYLDEHLVSFLNSLPVWYKTNLCLPPGLGDKFLLRLVAYRLGLRNPAFLTKRAIQFGSRIAKMETGLKGTDLCPNLQQKNV
ncbi:Asparagine synthetase domain-containing protein 1 [Chamberlinius hualienensis]